MKIALFLAGTAAATLSSAAIAAPVYVNFTDDATPVPGFNSANGSTQLTDAVDSEGNATSIDIRVTASNPTRFDNRGYGTTDGFEATDGSPVEAFEAALSDSLEGRGAQDEQIVVTFLDLEPGTPYDISGSAAVRGSPADDQDGLYTIAGATSSTQQLDPSNNRTDIFDFDGVLPDENGRITLTVTSAKLSTNIDQTRLKFFLGAVAIEAAPVPEPAAAGVALGMGSLALLRRSRN